MVCGGEAHWRKCYVALLMVRIFGSRFHYKIKRQLDMSLDKVPVEKYDYYCKSNTWRMSAHVCLCYTRALATAKDLLIDHVDISQAFLQDNLLWEKGFADYIYISLFQAMVRMQNMSITFVHRHTVPAPAVRHCTKPCQLLWSGKASRQSASKNPCGAIKIQTDTRSWWAVTVMISACAA